MKPLELGLRLLKAMNKEPFFNLVYDHLEKIVRIRKTYYKSGRWKTRTIMKMDLKEYKELHNQMIHFYNDMRGKI